MEKPIVLRSFVCKECAFRLKEHDCERWHYAYPDGTLVNPEQIEIVETSIEECENTKLEFCSQYDESDYTAEELEELEEFESLDIPLKDPSHVKWLIDLDVLKKRRRVLYRIARLGLLENPRDMHSCGVIHYIFGNSIIKELAERSLINDSTAWWLDLQELTDSNKEELSDDVGYVPVSYCTKLKELKNLKLTKKGTRQLMGEVIRDKLFEYEESHYSTREEFENTLREIIKSITENVSAFIDECTTRLEDNLPCYQFAIEEEFVCREFECRKMTSFYNGGNSVEKMECFCDGGNNV